MMDGMRAQENPWRPSVFTRKGIVPGGAAGLQTRLGAPRVPGWVRLPLLSANLLRPFFFACLAWASSWTSDCTAAAASTDNAGHFIEVNHVQLYTEISGSGPPLMFLHGGLNYFDKTFAKQRAYFSDFRTVIGVDQRGHGHSPDNEQPFSYRQMAEDTAALIQKLGLGPVDIVGYSDGGNVGLLIARFHPELVRRLVITGANMRGVAHGLWDYVKFRVNPASRFASYLPQDLRPAYALVSPDGDQHWMTVVAKTKELWATWTVIEPSDLHAIQIPVLVLEGEYDAPWLEQAQEIQSNLPNAKLTILPGAGHDAMNDRTDEFNRAVRAFLEEPQPPVARSGR